MRSKAMKLTMVCVPSYRTRQHRYSDRKRCGGEETYPTPAHAESLEKGQRPLIDHNFPDAIYHTV